MIWDNLELPKAYYQDDSVYIIHADCREVLPLIPDKSIDLVLTDIPFNVGKEYGVANDDLSETEYYDFIKGIGLQLFYCMADLSSLLIKIPTKYLPLVTQSLYCLRYKWAMGLYVPNSMKPFAKGFNQLGLVLWYYKIQPLKVKFSNDVYSHNRNGELRTNGLDHPNPMDENFVIRLLEDYSDSDNLILDPFLGSGTTCYCAKKLGRKCIGIEISEKYCEIAAKRCQQTVMNLEVETPKVLTERLL